MSYHTQYLASQLSGPYVQSLMNSIGNEITLASGEIEYMHDFAPTATVASSIMETMGELVGYKWPLTPSGLAVGAGLFTFCIYTANPIFVAYSGFGSVTSGTCLSGQLSSIYETTRIGQDLYAQLLPIVAQIKWNGLTLSGIDAVCQIFGDHTISYQQSISGVYDDIKVVFSPDISAYQLYVLNDLFPIFATSPQVYLYNA